LSKIASTISKGVLVTKTEPQQNPSKHIFTVGRAKEQDVNRK